MEKLIILLVISALYLAKAVLEARAAAKKGKQQALAEAQKQEEIVLDDVQAAPKRKQKRRKQPKNDNHIVLELDSEPSFRRGTLSRELNPLGEGNRIEAAPGTLNASQLAASSFEPAVKPELASLTGIYDVSANDTVSSVPVMDLQKFLTEPSGIRQGIIWSEILKRPEW